MSRGGVEYVLALIESPGKIVVLKKTSSQWQKVSEIALPSSASFSDYSDLTISGNKVAITSQEESKLWIGTLSSTEWALAGGKTYSFPTGNSSGEVFLAVQYVREC